MGGAAIGAALISGGLDAAGGFMGNSAARSAARVQRHWEERMANTAIVRRKADLEAAGFNPLLAVGQSAATPEVSSAQQVNPLGGAAAHISSAGQMVAQLKIQQAVAQSQIGLNHSLAEKAQAEARVVSAQADQQPNKTAAEIAALSGAGARDVGQAVNLPAEGREIAARIRNFDASTSLAEQHALDSAMQRYVLSLDAQQKRQVMAYITSEAQAIAALRASGVPEARNKADAQSTMLARWATYFGQTLGNLIPGFNSAGSAAGAAYTVGKMMR